MTHNNWWLKEGGWGLSVCFVLYDRNLLIDTYLVNNFFINNKMENNDNSQPNDRERAYLIKSDMLTNQEKQVYGETE